MPWFHTRHRDAGNTHSPVYYLDSDFHWDGFHISEIHIPYTWYNARSSMTLTVTEATGGDTDTFTVPSGHFSDVQEYLDDLTALVNASSVLTYDDYKLSYNNAEGGSHKVTIESEAKAAAAMDTITVSMTDTLARKLGFPYSTTYSGDVSYTAPDVAHFNDTVIYIESDDLNFDGAGAFAGKGGHHGTNANRASTRGVVARIVNTSTTFGQMIYVEPYYPIVKRRPASGQHWSTSTMQKVEFRLLYEDHQPIDLNGHDWSIRLVPYHTSSIPLSGQYVPDRPLN